MPRFVILKHQPGPDLPRIAGVHLDWMFEFDRSLRTWATDVFGDKEPMADAFAQPLTLPAQQLADHRADYLDFEGEVSGGRGQVTRILQGTFRVRENPAVPTNLLTENLVLDCHIQFDSGMVYGTIHLIGPANADADWTICWSPDDTPRQRKV